MNRRILLPLTFALAAVNPFTLCGADFPDSPDRLSLGARFGLNFKADFRNISVGNAVPGAASGGVDHGYDDGYVRVDSSGNAGGLTWNWGYQNSAQVVGDTMQFHATQAGTASGSDIRHATDDPQIGTELTYQRVIGSLPVLPHGQWGFEAALGYTYLDLRNNSTGTRLDTAITDTYQLNGVLPPSAGYNGTFNGPGALLSDTPTRASATSVSSLATHQKLSGQLYSLRLGPFAECNFTPNLSLAASVGITLAPASVDYDFTETSTVAGGGTSVVRGQSSKNDLLYGPYVGATLRYDFDSSWGVFIGAQFQSLTDMNLSIGSRTARLDQGATVYGTLGFSCRF